LSGFFDPEVVKQRHENDFTIKENGINKTIRVPIFSMEDMGENMAIDEKQIGEEMHTVLSNRQTGKIALLVQSLKAKELIKLLPKFDCKGLTVKSITRDLSPSYDWFCRQTFYNALHAADKFHIIKNLLDACQDVRIRYRQELLTDKRKKYEAFKKQEHQRKQECKEKNQLFIAQKFVYNESKNANGETLLELLARSRYLLYKYPDDWTNSQKERALNLFNPYPEIEKSYKLSCNFRTWYRKENIGIPREDMRKRLQMWYLEVGKEAIMEMDNFKSLVERNEGIILNYFVKGDTNAKAETLNSKIQRFIMMNRGTRDIEFFYFRWLNFFVQHLKIGFSQKNHFRELLKTLSVIAGLTQSCSEEIFRQRKPLPYSALLFENR
jgi:transposase